MAFELSIGGVTPDDLTGDPNDAVLIIMRAKELAPCLPSFDDGTDEHKAVLAVLMAVAKRAASIGTGTIASQSRNGTSRTYRYVRSAFFPENISALRMLCPDGTAPSQGALPVGSFPIDRPISRIFPEGRYS